MKRWFPRYKIVQTYSGFEIRERLLLFTYPQFNSITYNTIEDAKMDLDFWVELEYSRKDRKKASKNFKKKVVHVVC